MRQLIFFYVTSLLCILSASLQAQVDTEFWFAPPEVSSGHGDQPIYIRISTLDKPASIKIIQPARQNEILFQTTIAANTTYTIDLTFFKTNLEPGSPASIQRNGIKIESTAPVTAYYEIGAPLNAEIFALKGKNALGNRFMIAGQNFYHSGQYFPTPFFSFDVVATRDNTIIRVKPSRQLQGHLTDTLILVRLNAGETYSFSKLSPSAFDNPVGTIVESNKPVAITIKDDSVINGVCRDLLGDQLIPVEVTGTEYVISKGFLGQTEYVFVTAIENKTEVFFADAQSSVTINAGEVYRYPVVQKSLYITSTKNIYVAHVTGFGCEMGMAIVPSINCKGSTQVGFARTTEEFFGLNLLVRKEAISDFKINGSTTLISSQSFTPVPGTNDKWYTAQLELTNQIGVGVSSTVTNSRSSFQMGIINGNAASTCRYGYFSSFSTLFIGDDFALCEGESATLDAGPNKESYLWSTAATTQQIQVQTAGKYWVKVVREDCELYDTVSVDVKKGVLDIVSSTQICAGEKTKVDGKANFSWQWSNGSVTRFLETSSPGKYWVQVVDYTGCKASDTVYVLTRQGPSVELGDDNAKCRHEEIVLNANFPGATYRWNDQSTNPTKIAFLPGTYKVAVTFNGCTVKDSVKVINLPGPLTDSIFGSPSVCPWVEKVDYHIEEKEALTYEWFVNGGSLSSSDKGHIKVDWGAENARATVRALITDSDGCRSDTVEFPVVINRQLIAEHPHGPDTLCLNDASSVVYTTPYTNNSLYTWSSSGGKIVAGQGSNIVKVDFEEGINTLVIQETSTTREAVCAGTSPELKIFVFRDTSSVFIKSVSVDTTDASLIHVDWSLLGPMSPQSAYLSKEFQNSGSAEVTKIQASNFPFISQNNETETTSYLFSLDFVNRCGEMVTSETHQTILLSAESDETETSITLTWNSYEGWLETGRYEIWRKIDDDNGFRPFANVVPTATSLLTNTAKDGFNHQYIIRALNKSGTAESWSNPVSLTFDHDIIIPNVITQNSDQINDTFQIQNIHLYKKSFLRIVDRWGKIVYEAKNYDNTWSAHDLGSGVYYYWLDSGIGKTFKGWVHVMR